MTPGQTSNALDGQTILLSASYPSTDRDPRYLQNTDVREISNATLALINAVFSAGGRLVFGGHPTITPLALQQAGLFFDPPFIDPPSAQHPHEPQPQATPDAPPQVIIYQSRVFAQVIPAAAKTIAASPYGKMVTTDFQPGGGPAAERANGLLRMRAAMLNDQPPLAAVFIGGMEGVEDEYQLCAELQPGTRRYLIGAPGGAARLLLADHHPAPEDSPAWLATLLRESHLYPYLMAQVVRDMAADRVHDARIADLGQA